MAQKESGREVLSAGAGLAAEVALESGGQLGELQTVRARGYWEQVWLRFRKDKVAIASGFVILIPVGPLTHTRDFNPETGKEEALFFPLGTADTLGRDELLRLMYGARVSLQVAVGATLLSMLIGVLLGATAGYFRGWIDALISRLTEIVMAFPLLLFVIALAATVGDRMQDVTFGGALPPGVLMLVLVGGV